jgi:hypothetical protein
MNIYNTIIIVSLITLSPLIIPLVDTQFVKSLEPYQNSSIWFPFSFVLLCPIMWHTFVSLPLDGFAMSITPLVSSSLLILGPSTSSPNVTALNMKKSRCNTNKPPHDFLVLCEFVPYSLCRKPNRRFAWLVDELSKLQPCLELCRFAWALLKPRLQDRKCHFLREWHENQIIISFLNGWCITRGTQPKREMVCLKSRCCN